MLKPHDAFAAALHVVNANPVGMMCTVGPDGAPHARWMTTVAVEGLGKLWTMSRRKARKIDDLAAEPRVCWVFTSEEGDTVTLCGRAYPLEGALAASSVWDHLAERTREYAMGPLSGDADLELVAIETVVESLELLSPRHNIFQPLALPVGGAR